MPTIKRFRTFNICMYFDDHGVPHFHIVSADENASVAIDTLEVLAGSVNKARLKEAKAWASSPIIHECHRALACSFARNESLISRPYAWLRSSSSESVANKGPAQPSRRFMNSAG